MVLIKIMCIALLSFAAGIIEAFIQEITNKHAKIYI